MAKLTIRILREIQNDLTVIKNDVASIKETQRFHGMRLNTHSENFAEMIGLLRDVALASDLRALAAPIAALESVRQ